MESGRFSGRTFFHLWLLFLWSRRSHNHAELLFAISDCFSLVPRVRKCSLPGCQLASAEWSLCLLWQWQFCCWSPEHSSALGRAVPLSCRKSRISGTESCRHTHWARSNGLGRSHTEITWRLVRAWQRSLEGQGGRQRVQPWMRWAVPTGGCHSSATLPHCPGTVAQLHSADGLCYPNTGLLLIPPLMFIMVILKLPAMNEPLKDWDQHKGRVKLSVPHSTHCFKGLSRAQSYSGVR